MGEASNPRPSNEEVGSDCECFAHAVLSEVAPTKVHIDDEWSTPRGSRKSPMWWCVLLLKKGESRWQQGPMNSTVAQEVAIDFAVVTSSTVPVQPSEDLLDDWKRT